MAAILIATTSGLLLASTPKKKSRPSMKTRTAKSSALINKTLELHTGNTDRLSRSDILFIMLLHTQTHTHTCVRAFQSFLLLCSFGSCVQKCGQHTWDRHPLSVSVSLSSSTPSLLPLRAGKTRALQPNKGNLRRHPLYPTQLLLR